MLKNGKTSTFLYVLLPAFIVCHCAGDGVRKKSLWFEGKRRTYLVETPLPYSTVDKVPLVIVLHGRNESGGLIRYRIGNDRFFSKNGMLTVYPDGSGNLRRNWNDVDREMSFIDALLDTLSASYNIDMMKCYLAGFSQGGMLSYKFACSSGKIAAVAMVASSIDSQYVMTVPEFPRPVSLISINAATDRACPMDSFTYKGKWFNSVAAGISAWRNRNGCTLGPEVTMTPPCATMRRWKNQRGDETVLWTTVDGGHAWPGGRGILLLPHFKPSRCLDANRLLLDFFTRHSECRGGQREESFSPVASPLF